MRKPHFIDNPLRDYRLKNYLLQDEVAKRCGMDDSMWSLIECLKRTPSLLVAYRISQRTGIPLEEIARFCARRKPSGKTKGKARDSGERGRPARPDRDLTAEH